MAGGALLTAGRKVVDLPSRAKSEQIVCSNRWCQLLENAVENGMCPEAFEFKWLLRYTK